MRFDSPVTVRIRDAYAARHEPEAQRLLGTYYWTLLIILIFLAFAFALIFGAYEFMRPLSDEGLSGVNTGARKQLTKVEIDRVFEGLEVRANTYDERLRASMPKDPS